MTNLLDAKFDLFASSPRASVSARQTGADSPNTAAPDFELLPLGTPEMCEACGEEEVALSVYCRRCAHERGVRADPPDDF